MEASGDSSTESDKPPPTGEGYSPEQVVKRLHDRQVIASVVPGFYNPLLARVAPSLLTVEEDVERTVRAIAAL